MSASHQSALYCHYCLNISTVGRLVKRRHKGEFPHFLRTFAEMKVFDIQKKQLRASEWHQPSFEGIEDNFYYHWVNRLCTREVGIVCAACRSHNRTVRLHKCIRNKTPSNDDLYQISYDYWLNGAFGTSKPAASRSLAAFMMSQPVDIQRHQVWKSMVDDQKRPKRAEGAYFRQPRKTLGICRKTFLPFSHFIGLLI